MYFNLSVCKSLNHLISNTKFHKKHLSVSTTHNVHWVNYSYKLVLKSIPLDFVFTNVTTTDTEKLRFSVYHCGYLVGSCNGILCLAVYYEGSVLVQFRLRNPSIRKFKELPPHENSREPLPFTEMMNGFGYDPVNDNYKVVSALRVFEYISGNIVAEDEVKVHTLGTNSWKSIQVFPFVVVPIQKSGQCVSGTINWLASKDTNKSQCFILSFDLGNESYQKVLFPNDIGKVDACTLHLSVLRDCLIMFSGDDVWIMKEYGNKESWTKLCAISHRPTFMKAIYVFKDEQVLFKCIKGWRCDYIFYNSRDGTSKCIRFENTPGICVKSLISPCS